MKFIIAKYIILGAVICILLIPIAAFAVPAGGGYNDPLKGTTLPQLITRVIQYMLELVGVLSLLALVVGGTRIVLGFADENQVKTGKQVIYWAILGLAVAILSWSIINIVTRDILKVT